jgi:hypothetical protein
MSCLISQIGLCITFTLFREICKANLRCSMHFSVMKASYLFVNSAFLVRALNPE